MKITLSAALLFCAGVGLPGVASAQVATPPPAQLPAPDANIPKPAPRTERKITRFGNPGPGAVTPQRAPNYELPKDVDLLAMIERDADGKIKRYEEPLHFVSLRKNPKIPSDFWDRAGPYIAERTANVQHVLANNVDIIEKIEDGAFEKVDILNRDSIKELMDMMRPVQFPAAPKPLTEDLRDKKHLEVIQQMVCDRMIREYAKALIAEDVAAQEARGEQVAQDKGMQAQRLLVSFYKQSVDEYMCYYHNALLFMSERTDDVLPAINADADAQAKARAIARTAKAAPDRAGKLGAMKELRGVLTLEQRKAMLTRVFELMNAGA